MHIVFHCNFTQPHQIEHGQWLKEGFRRHGLDVEVTPSVDAPGDLHIVSGPHYALERWPDCLWLDRALFHVEHSGKWKSMDWVSLGFVRGGVRAFREGVGRSSPTLKSPPESSLTIFLRDFNGKGPHFPVDTVRSHPAEGENKLSLIDDLRRHGKAIGYSTTALITAALEGLEVHSLDPNHILNNPNWLRVLPYADWHYSEIQSGDAWEHLKNDFDY